MRLIELYRTRYEHHGHHFAGRATVGRGGQMFMRPNSRDAVREFRPYFRHAPLHGYGPGLEEFTDQTPLTVGSPQQVIEKPLTSREHFGDDRRHLFLLDHAGLPLPTSLEQMEMMDSEVIAVLRHEMATDRPAHVPDSPTHASPMKSKGQPVEAAAR